MALTQDDMKKIAHLARLNLSNEDLACYTPQLDNIMTFIQKMNTADTTDIEALAHPLDLSQRLRADEITESNQREEFQRIAPQVEAGLYLVPKVIEEV